MNRLLRLVHDTKPDDNRRTLSKSSKSKQDRRAGESKSQEKTIQRHQTHFYDPEGAENIESSSDEVGLPSIHRRQKDTLDRVQDAEAALAKERKRMEQLELRRKEVEANEEQRHMQPDDEAHLSPREKNRRAYERAVNRVERRALRRIEELERRFAHSDKIFELQNARQEMEANERKDKTSQKETNSYQPPSGKRKGDGGNNETDAVRDDEVDN
jgi:ribosomal protein S30